MHRIPKRAAAIVGAFLTALVGVVGLSASPAAAADTWSCGAITQVSWGAGQLCENVGDGSPRWKIAALDKVTDGYCVEVRYSSADHGGAYVNYPDRARSCTTGGWKTITQGNYSCDGVRAYRDDGAWFTVALPPSC